MAESPRGALWEQLLLAQTVYQLGASPPVWARVADALHAHPLVREAAPDAAWSAEQCADTWHALMRTHDLTDASDAHAPRPGRPAQLALAQRLYGARLTELHEQIQHKETQFRYAAPLTPSELHQRLLDLEAGKLDAQLAEEHGVSLTSSPSRKRPADAQEAADDEEEINEHLQVEQDLLGAAPADAARTAGDDAREERASAQPTTTYKSRTRRRTAEASRTPSPARGGRRSRGRSPEASEHSANEDAADGVSDAERDKTRRRTTQVLLMLHNQVSNHTHGNLFHQAIKEVDAPHYYALVKHPMDLKLIKQRIKEGAIASMPELRHALSLMFANALMYNRPDTEVHRMANEMRLATDEVRTHGRPPLTQMLDQFEHTA